MESSQNMKWELSEEYEMRTKQENTYVKETSFKASKRSKKMEKKQE